MRVGVRMGCVVSVYCGFVVVGMCVVYAHARAWVHGHGGCVALRGYMGRRKRRRGSWLVAGDNWLIAQESDVRIACMLTEARVLAGITQRELGEMLHVSVSLIRKVEHCDHSVLSWVRYMPKVLAWMQACCVDLQFRAVVRKPEAGHKAQDRSRTKIIQRIFEELNKAG